MIAFFSRYKKGAFIFTAGFFLIAIFVGLGSYLGSDARNFGAVAIVGKDKIPYSKFYRNYSRALDNLREKGLDVPDALEKQMKQEIMRDMIVQQLLVSSARQYGFEVPDFEIAAEIRSNPAFYNNGVFSQELYYRGVMSGLRMKPADYEAERRDARLGMKFRNLIFATSKVTPKELEDAYLLKNKSMANFEKNKDEFTRELIQEKSIASINYYLKDYTSRIRIQDLLAEREKGA